MKKNDNHTKVNIEGKIHNISDEANPQILDTEKPNPKKTSDFANVIPYQ